MTPILVLSEVASLCLNLVWASVLHTEAYRHRLEVGMIDEALRHSPEHAPSEPSPCASRQARQRPKTMWCISHRARFFRPTRWSEPKLEGGTFSPALIPSPAMNRQLLSQLRPHRNQSLVYFSPKPCLSNLAHFITPVIRPLLPHRTACSIPSRFMPTSSPMCFIKAVLLSQQRPTRFYLMSREPPLSQSWAGTSRLCNRGTGVCWGRSCRMRDIHTNANQMEG